MAAPKKTEEQDKPSTTDTDRSQGGVLGGEDTSGHQEHHEQAKVNLVDENDKSAEPVEHVAPDGTVVTRDASLNQLPGHAANLAEWENSEEGKAFIEEAKKNEGDEPKDDEDK